MGHSVQKTRKKLLVPLQLVLNGQSESAEQKAGQSGAGRVATLTTRLIKQKRFRLTKFNVSVC